MTTLLQSAERRRRIYFSSAAPIQFDFDFYDLEIIPGLFANGTAEISVHADGVNDDPEYFVGRIFLHGAQSEREEVKYEDGDELEKRIHLAIFNELDTGSLAGQVADRMVRELV